MLVMMGMLLVGACGGGEDDAADTAPASTNSAGKPIVIRTKILVAAPERWTRYGIRISGFSAVTVWAVRSLCLGGT
jgi:hypothetical protein